MQLKSGIYWNTQCHQLVGFASNWDEMDLAKEIEMLNNVVDGEIDKMCMSESFDMNNSNPAKVNQWHFHSIKGIVHKQCRILP